MATHFIIPDTQAKPDAPTTHLEWIGRYLVDKFADRPDVKVVHLGDHADMPSLSSYDKGKKSMEGRRYVADVDAANRAFDVLNAPLRALNARRRKNKERQWHPERHLLLGNHEDRITRACESSAEYDGLLSLDHLNYASHGWVVHPFLEVVWIDGVAYSHYFYNPMSGRPYSGENLKLRLKNIGHSFTMGHQQTLDYAIRFVGGNAQQGLVAGACYLHDEDYKGPQGNAHWRGVIVCYSVSDGAYDPKFVSLDSLCQRYEGVTLDEYMASEGITPNGVV